MPRVDVIDLLAVLIGIYSATRRLQLSKPVNEIWPGALSGQAESWRRRLIFAYGLASLASFLKVAVDIAYQLLAMRLAFSATALRFGGMFIDLSWVVIVIFALQLASRTRRAALRSTTPDDRAR